MCYSAEMKQMHACLNHLMLSTYFNHLLEHAIDEAHIAQSQVAEVVNLAYLNHLLEHAIDDAHVAHGQVAVAGSYEFTTVFTHKCQRRGEYPHEEFVNQMMYRFVLQDGRQS